MDLKYIFKHYSNKHKYILLCGDFNLKHSSISLSSTSNYSKIDVTEYDLLSEMLVNYGLKVINKKEEPTYCNNVKGKEVKSVLDRSIASEAFTNNYYEWNTLDMYGSDHKPILSIFYIPNRLQLNQNKYINKSQKVKFKKYKFYAPIDIEMYKYNVILRINQLKDKYAHIGKDVELMITLSEISYEYFKIIQKTAAEYMIFTVLTENIWATAETINIAGRHINV